MPPLSTGDDVYDGLSGITTPFDSVQTAEQSTQFSFDPTDGLTERRYQWWSNGVLFDSTLFSEVEAGLRLETTSTATDSARIRTGLVGQYIAQSVAQPGLGMIVDDANTTLDGNDETSLSHGEVYVGAFWWDDVNDQVDTGVGYKFDETGMYYFVVSNGTHLGDSPVPQSKFSRDKLNGSGPSSVVLDPSNGYIYNWPYTWYNEGPLAGAILNPKLNKIEINHVELITGRPSIDTPNLPLNLVVRNNGTASSLGVELGGTQYTLYGATSNDIEFRETDIARVTEGSSYISVSKALTNGLIDPNTEPGVPLMAFQRASTFRDIALKIQQFESRPISDDIYVYQWDEYNPSTALTGQSFGSVPSQETGIQVDTSATDYSPSSQSLLRSVKFFEGGSKNQTGENVVSSSDTRIPSNATRVITAVNDGDASADVDPFIAKVEESY